MLRAKRRHPTENEGKVCALIALFEIAAQVNRVKDDTVACTAVYL